MTFHKFHKIVGIHRWDETPRDVQITEKFDGANFRFMLDEEGNIVWGSRKRSPPDPKIFEPISDWIIEQMGDSPLRSNFIYYGEAMIPHKIKYRPETPMFIGFAVYDTDHEEYVEDWKTHFHEIGLVTTPIIYEGKYNGFMDGDGKSYVEAFVNDPTQFQSFFSDEPIEGMVIADYLNQIFYKVVRADFIEVKQKKLRNPQEPMDDFVERYATEARISKAVHGWQPKNGSSDTTVEYKLQMKDVSAVGWQVMQDIAEEEFRAIMKALGKPAGQLVSMVIKAVLKSEAFNAVVKK